MRGEGNLRRLFEVNADLRGLLRELLAHADVEGHALPAPGVDEQTQRHVGLGLRLGIHAVFLTIPDTRDTIDTARRVLGADDICTHGLGADERAQRTDDLHLFIADGVGAEIGWRLHGHEAEELEEVVLHHVTQRAGGVVVATASAFHAEVFGAGDLHVVDVAAVPVRLEERVGKAQHHDVLGGLFAQVMVDAVGVVFRKGARDGFIKRLRGGEVFAKRLLTHHTRPFAADAGVQTGGLDHLQDGFEGLRCGGEVEESVRRRAAFLVELIEQDFESDVARRIFELAAVVVDALAEAGPKLVVVALAGVFAVPHLKLRAEDLIGFVATGKADHLELRR